MQYYLLFTLWAVPARSKVMAPSLCQQCTAINPFSSEYHMQIHFHVDKTHAFCAQWHDGWAPKIWQYLLFAACAFKRLCSPYLLPSLDMESAIKTVVTTFLGSARGKECLNTSSFKKMVQKQLGNIMEVKSGTFTLYHHVSGYTKIYLSIIIIMCVCVYYFNLCILCLVCYCLPQDTDSGSAIKEMQRGLDENNDGKVSFQEYLTLIGYLANSVSERKFGQQNSGSSADAS